MKPNTTPEFPVHWERTTIGVLVERKVWQSGPTAGDEFTYVDISSIDNRTKRITDPKLLSRTEAPSRAKQVLVTGDVLVSMTRPNLNAVALIPPDLNQAIGSTGFDVLRTQIAEPSWLFYAVQTNDFVQAMCKVVQGALYPAVRPDDIRSYVLPLPPLAEQRRIVAKLDELFSDLDAGVAALQRARANLKRYRAAVLKAAVAGRLTEQWRAAHPATEPATPLLERILAERRRQWEADQLAKYAAAGKTPPKNWQAKYVEPPPRETSGLPEVPPGWCWTSLGQCFPVHVGATPSRSEPTYWNGTIPWVSSGEIQFCRIAETREGITRVGLANSSTQINPAGFVLLGMIGEGRTRGQVALLEIDAANNQNCAAIWVSVTPVLPLYVYYWLWSQYEETRQRGSGNNQPALNKSRVEVIPLPLPPLDEQAEIVADTERRLSILDATEAEVETTLHRAARLRQSILKRAFAGQLVPQDANDEPANVLLERIRRQRASTADSERGKMHPRHKRKDAASPSERSE